MRWIVEGLAEQAFGRRRIAQRRQQEVDGGTRGIDGPIKVTPTALHANIGLIDPPGFAGRLEMTAQPLFQCGTVTLNPTPDRRVIRLQTALSEQLFDIAQRRQQEVDGGTRGIDGPIELTPTTLHSNIRFINTLGFVGRLDMTA